MANQSFLDTLAAAISSPSVTLHSFLLEFKKQSKIIHAFFEGKTDESFYGTFIRNVMKDGYILKTYVCGNKDGVYYYYSHINGKDLGENIALYFVDKDIEDIIPFHREVTEKIYVTDYYSVENYIVSSVILEQIWGEIFRQGSGSVASKLVLTRFEICLREFYNFMLTVMAWVLYHRRNIESKENVKLNLDCVKLKAVYRIDEELDFHILGTPDNVVEVLSSQTGCMTDMAVWNNNCKKLIEELRMFPPKHIVRGHFEMEFFVYFIHSTKSALAKAMNKALKVHIELTDANSIDVLGPRTQIPVSLDQYLLKHVRPQLEFCNI